MTLLPTKLHEPSSKFSDYIGFLAGEKKVGKTSFCAQFPNHFIIEMEVGNAKHLACRYADCPDLKTLNGLVKELKDNPKYCQTLIIDEVNVIYELVCENIVKREGVNDLSELGWAKGWSEASRRTEAYLRQFHALGVGVIYTGHTEIKTTKDRRQREISTMEVSCKKAITKLMERYTHWGGCMLFDEDGTRILQIVGDGFVKAYNCFDNHFKNVHGGKIPLGNSPEQAYKNFMRAFKNEDLDLVDGNTGKNIVGNTNAKGPRLRTSKL